VSLGIILIGACGRMGKEIANLVFADDQLSLIAAVEHASHPDLGKDYGLVFGKSTPGITLTSSFDKIAAANHVGIDFSSPQSLQQYLPKAAAAGLPMVIGTTGLTQKDNEYIKSFATEIPLLVSPNMSLGVNILFLITEMISNRLKDDYDIEIIEAHHRFKKDAPSGTAKRLGEIVAESIGEPYDLCVKDGRRGISTSDRPHKEIGMHAVRGGDIVGDHTVLFAGIGERIELRHMAHSRSTFARGALIAAKWLSKKKPGLYTMRNMLEL
jgi:4-hydroxy-tetrahydrodipicolinate reductase